MAEVLGIMASSGQFLEQSIKIVKLSKKLYDNIRDAPSDIQKFRDEIEQLRTLVDSTKTSPSLQVDDLKPTIDRCHELCRSFLDILVQINFEKTDGLGRKTWKAVGGLAKESEIRNYFQQLERLKSTLSSRIAVINL